MVSSETIAALLKERDPQKSATAFIGHKDLPEPLMAIWEPHAIEALENHYLVEQKNCPRKFLINSDIKLIQPASEREVFNANSPEEYQRAKEWIK
jgi:molybdopterin-guanine dinucleotide biosynthesis protein A